MAGVGRRSRSVTRPGVVAVIVVAVALGVSIVSVSAASASHHQSAAGSATADIALVSGFESHDLTPVDLSTEPPSADAALPLQGTRSPSDVATLGPDTVLVLGEGTRDLTTVRLVGGHPEITSRIGLPAPGGRNPNSLSVSRDGRRAVVTYPLNFSVVTVDLSANPPVVGPPVSLDDVQATASAITPNGDTALIASGNQNPVVARIDLRTNPATVLGPIRLPLGSTCGIAVAPDGKYALATVGLDTDNLAMIDLTKNPPAVVASVRMPGRDPCRVLIAPDSTKAYVANLRGNSVTPVSIAGDTVTPRPSIGLNGGDWPMSLALTHDGKRLIVTNSVTSDLTPIDLTVDPPRPGARIPLGGARRADGLAILSVPLPPGQRTSTTLSPSVNPSVTRQGVRLTATVSSRGGAEPEGSVTFSVDGRQRGSPVTLRDGTATIVLQDLRPAHYRVTARYSGDPESRPSSREQVLTVNRAASSTSLRASVDPSVSGQRVVLTVSVGAVAPGRGQPSGKVTFAVDGKAVGSAVPLVGGSVSVIAPRLAPGTRAVTATYAGDDDFAGSSATLAPELRVDLAATRVTVTSEPTPAVTGTPLVILATVGVVEPGGGTPQGAVTFTIDGAAPTEPVPLVDGAALHLPELAPGRHHVDARYSGSAEFKGATGSLDLDVGTP